MAGFVGIRNFVHGCKIVENILGPVCIGQHHPVIRRFEHGVVQNEQVGSQALLVETVCCAATK
jgi:hypothetical protein